MVTIDTTDTTDVTAVLLTALSRLVDAPQMARDLAAAITAPAKQTRTWTHVVVRGQHQGRYEYKSNTFPEQFAELLADSPDEAAIDEFVTEFVENNWEMWCDIAQREDCCPACTLTTVEECIDAFGVADGTGYRTASSLAVLNDKFWDGYDTEPCVCDSDA